MSVVAGCSLFDGVLLAADCRMTIERRGAADVYVDNVQKLFPVADGTALGFVGHMKCAGDLLQMLFSQLGARRHQDPISLSTWMPRFFRMAYGKVSARMGQQSVAFMVASAIRGRPNSVERESVAEIVRRIGWGKSPVKRNWMPGLLVEILKVPVEYQYVRIPGTSLSILYVMRAPYFEIEAYRPLQFAAIGSGKSVFEEIADYHDMIVAGDPGNSFIEASTFTDAISNFIQEKKIRNVGGLYPS